SRREADPPGRGEWRAEHKRTRRRAPPVRPRAHAPRLCKRAAAHESRRGGDETSAATNREVDGLAVFDLRALERPQVAPILELVRKERVPLATPKLLDRVRNDRFERLDDRLDDRREDAFSARANRTARTDRGVVPDDAQHDGHATAPSRLRIPVRRCRRREAVALSIFSEECAGRERGRPASARYSSATANRSLSRCRARRGRAC